MYGVLLFNGNVYGFYNHPCKHNSSWLALAGVSITASRGVVTGALLDAVVEAAAGHARLVAAVGDRHRRANLADHRADAVASVLNRHLTALENVWRFTTQC